MSALHTLPRKLAQASLAGFLFFSAGVTAAQAEDFPPQLVQLWKEYLKNYPAAQAEYKSEQETGRKTAKPVVLSKQSDGDQLIKAYPVLRDNIKDVRDTEEKIIANPDPKAKQSVSIKTLFHAAEIKNAEPGINVLFFAKDGALWCGAHGCTVDVYIDTGKGYEKTQSFIVGDQMYSAKIDGHFVLFAGDPQKPLVKEWVIKDGQLVENTPPPAEPQSSEFQEWKEQQMQAGKWPPE